jgi:tetraprenyl-beta-curcumene synthase
MSSPRLSLRVTAALMLANARYWTTVAPLVRAELSRWERRVQDIPDEVLRELARGKLREERFNVEVAATMATLAPGPHRERVVEAIVALQVMYDYLDVLGEQPVTVTDRLREERYLLTALTDAVDPQAKPGRDYYRHRPLGEDGGYLAGLVAVVRSALAGLPGTDAIAHTARHAATRCVEAQALNHAAADLGTAPLEDWATREVAGTTLGWQAFLAGASASVLALHALIAAAADQATTPARAEQLDALYLSIGALTMLDSVADYERDLLVSQPGYIQYFGDHELLGRRLAQIARETVAHAQTLPHAAHHIMTLAGLVSFYLSAPSIDTELGRSITAPVRSELRGPIAPTLAVMRTWRRVKQLRQGRRRGSHHSGSITARATTAGRSQPSARIARHGPTHPQTSTPR